MIKFWRDYPEMYEELIDVKGQIIKNARCKDKIIENSIIELAQSGGKMIRPGFIILASKFGDYNQERSKALAAVIEMFHMATLVHDDIIDDSSLRRGKETIQSKYGKNYAVYIGDYLFCLCFRILATTSSIERGIEIDTKVMSKICLGEIEQLNSRFNKEISIKDYLKRISGKTAELFSLSLYIGAAESSCDKKICRLFWEIGHNIGMAFQIIDDILDYSIDRETCGKETLIDLKEGIYTLPLLFAIKENPKVFENVLDKKTYNDQDIKVIARLVRENKGIEKSRALAKKYTYKAFRDINKLPDNKYKVILKEVTENMINRNY